MLRNLVIAGVLLAAAAVAALYLAGRGAFGAHEGAGEPSAPARSAASVAAEAAAQRAAAPPAAAEDAKQILFGDLHVHSSFSDDAFLFSLPLLGGEGAHPPSDACDFARYCSALDFFSMNDHAENLTPEHWHETVASVRACNAKASDAANPDLVAYLGWEWTQIGTSAEDHYGHKNVVLRDLEEGAIPARPIGAVRPAATQFVRPSTLLRGATTLALGGRYHEWARFQTESEEVDRCASDVPTRELPADCIELAATPADLFAKLNEWGVASIVIPHGTTWGMYTPPDSSWDKQLVGAMHDPERQTLIEVYSGHGDSEVVRSWQPVERGASGKPACPAPSANYLPSCWQAGEIIRARCTVAGESEAECEARAVETRANYVAAGLPGHLTVPGATADEWLDAGQCRDCREPAFNYRPHGSAQYIAALGEFASGAKPRRFRFGFMASSDNHFARAGTGYKQKHRAGMTESMNATRRSNDSGPIAALFRPPTVAPEPRSRPYGASTELRGFQLFETERQASMLTTGGLVAAHATARDRGAIWDALGRKEVYGTSGQRTLLWFDLVNAPSGAAPMGSEIALGTAPLFEVRAVGSFEQQPGCPDTAAEALTAEQLTRLCKGECHHPGDVRRAITRIEIVRIRPQQTPGEAMEALIEDPWRSFACDAAASSGCSVRFDDPDFVAGARETLYYARAFEAPELAINAGGVRCLRDATGACTKVNLCPSKEDPTEDCLAPREPRAWSSPIYLDFDPALVSAAPAEVAL